MNSPQKIRVGVLGGTRLPGNVETFLRNISSLLRDHPIEFEFDLLIRGDDTQSVPDFNEIDPGIDDTTRALSTLKTLTTATTQYSTNHPVDVLFQVTKFPVHGFAVTVAGLRTSTPVITRFAGDNFREHVFSGGAAGKARTYTLNNLIGTIPARLSDATIVLGPHGRNEIKKRNNNADVRIIPQPINFEQFQPVSKKDRAEIRKHLGISRDKRVLLTVGRLSERKGMFDLMAAAKSLADSEAEIRWYVVGKGPLRKKLEQTPLVVPTGRIPHKKMPDYYHAADLVVHPSLIEGLPNVLLEAAACGTPTISRNVGDSSIAASETYENPSCLKQLVLADYDPVDLGAQFSEDSLRKNYADVLVDVATESEHE